LSRHLAAEDNGLALLADLTGVAAEEFLFQTWTLNRHPEVVPRDNSARDVSCLIIAGHRAEEPSERALNDAKREGYYMFKRLSRISKVNEKILRDGGETYKENCPTLDASSAESYGLPGMLNRTRLSATQHGEVPPDRGSRIKSEICDGDVVGPPKQLDVRRAPENPLNEPPEAPTTHLLHS